MSTPNATFGEADLPGVAHPDPVFRSTQVMAGGWNVRWTDSTGSTNDDLWVAGRVGAPDRLVLVADHQTAGKGRLDRRWEAPAGANLLVSLLFRRIPEVPHAVTHAVGLAAAQACEQVADVVAALKWPNDVVVGRQKLAGILSVAGPMEGSPSRPSFVVVGLGLNVGWAPEGAASLVAESGRFVTRDDVLVALLNELDEVLSLSPEQLHDRYRRRLSTLNREVRIERPDSSFLEGRALDVESDGRLVLLDSC
ncbi:MAG: hypothetical protein RLZ19_880, partial [Actinomycetota bacterium]